MSEENIFRRIYCCQCGQMVSARLTDGAEIYHYRPDLASLPFWKCDGCENHVGCHHKSATREKPLGVIPTNEMRRYRKQIHEQMDPLWQSGKIGRAHLYKKISTILGWNFHAARLRTPEEAEKVLQILKTIREFL